MIGGVTLHILPHLPGVPHLHENMPLEKNTKRKILKLDIFYLVEKK